MRLLHIALALFAVGTNLSFPIWIRLAERKGSHLAFTLRAVRWIDRRVTIPAYVLVAATGLALAVIEGIPLATPWLEATAMFSSGLRGARRGHTPARSAAGVMGRTSRPCFPPPLGCSIPIRTIGEWLGSR